MPDLPLLSDVQIILAALSVYEGFQVDMATAHPNGSPAYTHHLQLADRTNQLHARLNAALKRTYTCPCGHTFTTTSQPAECPRCRHQIDEAA